MVGRLGDRANLLLLVSAWLLSRLLGVSSLFLCLLFTNHLVQIPNVIQERKAGVNAKNLMRRKVIGCHQPGHDLLACANVNSFPSANVWASERTKQSALVRSLRTLGKEPAATQARTCVQRGCMGLGGKGCVLEESVV